MARKRWPHRINVLRYTASVSAYGDASQRTWADPGLLYIWGHLRPLSGYDVRRAGRDTSEINHVCESSYNKDIEVRAKDRLVWDGDTYDVAWVENVGGWKRDIRIFCRRHDGA